MITLLLTSLVAAMPASSSLSVPSKAEYLSKRYGNSDDDRDRKEKKRRKKEEKKSKKNKKSKRIDERSSDDDDSLLGGSRAYRRDGDSDAESDEDGPLVVDEADHLDDVSNGDKEQGRGQRYDSEDDNDAEGETAPRRAPARTQKRRYDSDDASKGSPSPPRSSGEVAASSSGRARNQPRRYDSDDDESDNEHRGGVAIKHEVGRKRRYDSDDDDSDVSDSAKRKTASGHRAGLQSGRTFGSAEKRLHKSKRDEAQRTVDTHGIGETVYRDKASGRREAAAAGSAASDRPTASTLTEEEQAALLNVGRVQREAVEERHRRMEHMAASTFARHQDDDGLEEMRKIAIREGDPMAAYASAQGSSSKRKTNGGATVPQNVRPVYKGPPPKPNRYGIRPGFRWDGVDRGNGFEDRLLARRYNQQHQKELAYRMSSADM
jgi:pre-mRNA-splicing factor CWC26